MNNDIRQTQQYINTLVKNKRYLKKNLICDEIIIGMGAGSISKWMRELKFSL